jgi:glycosyltransferase involved in cell wall biosynthesis
MPAPTAVFCSFRLGGTDGVSVEARKWERALHELGFVTRRVAGELVDGPQPGDTELTFLAIDPPTDAVADPQALAANLAGADLVVVENLCSLPLNLSAARTAARVLDSHRGRVCFHHHDLPWERPELAHVVDLPPHRPGSLHVAISDHARAGLASRGIEARTIHNAFDPEPEPGDRTRTRATLGFDPGDLVVLQPTRAIPRKEVGRGIAFAEALTGILTDRTVRYWITGPAEDGYGPELARLLGAARVTVTEGRVPRAEDAYAAADVAVFPSSMEGFGNPVIEASVAGVPVAVARYPVLDELLALGLRLFSVDAPEEIVDWLRAPDPTLIEANRQCVRTHFDLADLPNRLTAVFTAIGWKSW